MNPPYGVGVPEKKKCLTNIKRINPTTAVNAKIAPFGMIALL